MLSSVLLMLALALAPVIGGGYGELASGILEILIFGGVVAHLVYSARGRAAWAWPPGLRPLAAFFLVVCISTAFSESIYASLNQLLFLSACLAGYVLSASISKDSRAAASTVWAFVLPALGICVRGVQSYAISTGGGAAFWKSLMSSGTHDRLFGTFINPGFFAGYLVLAIPITMGAYLVTRKTILALLAGIAVVLETVALMLTGTKFGIVSAVIALLVFFALAIPTGALRRARFKRFLVVAAVLLPLLIVFSRPVTSRIGEAEAGGSQVHSTRFRVLTWIATSHMIRDHALLGVGPGAFALAYPRYGIAGATKNAHQGYLQIASETGLVALAAFVLALLVVMWATLAAVFRARKDVLPGAQGVHDEQPGDGITWKDLVPFSGWRIVSCAIFAALAGSAARNLADSDWFVAGIALPFAVIMGTLVAQGGAVKRDLTLGRPARAAAIAACAAMAMLAVSFGLGDMTAPDEFGPRRGFQETLESYQLASRLSPLNPEYHRELGKYLFAAQEPEEGIREINTAIRLAPTDSGNYVARAIVASHMDEPAVAIRYYKKALTCNPNSTQTLYQLAELHKALGDTKAFEADLQRLLQIEQSDYEQVKGVPEIVDTTFARAHEYFGEKYLAQKNYTRAENEFSDVVDRLESWRKQPKVLEVQLYSGRLTKEEQADLLSLLRRSYLRLAEIYTMRGDTSGAAAVRRKAAGIGTSS